MGEVAVPEKSEIRVWRDDHGRDGGGYWKQMKQIK